MDHLIKSLYYTLITFFFLLYQQVANECVSKAGLWCIECNKNKDLCIDPLL